MRMRVLFKLVLALVSASFFSSHVAGQALTLKNLKTNETGVVNPTGKLSVVMLFQPDCSWCKKQEKALSTIHASCTSTFNFHIVGTQGSRNQLKRELNHYHQNISAYKSTTQFLRQVGGFKASPTTLFFDASGTLLGKRRGYLELLKMKQLINSLTYNKCE
ncbi:hypothetical protein SOPP22_16860 [Shewanella sp. OPT22]|nr:hypothetical protein SOPP22_16860 [Shewanella sp. OPT22]